MSFALFVLCCDIQYIPRNMHTVFALLCFVVVIHWLIFPYPSGLLYWHCGNLTIAPVPAKQPLWIWINTSCEFIMNDCITTTKQSTTKPCAYFLGYTVREPMIHIHHTLPDTATTNNTPTSISYRMLRIRHFQTSTLESLNLGEYLSLGKKELFHNIFIMDGIKVKPR